MTDFGRQGMGLSREKLKVSLYIIVSSVFMMIDLNSGNDWVRKQRLKEYRVAARRERRNRKSDEKKQRKLNATILRRMVESFVFASSNYC